MNKWLVIVDGAIVLSHDYEYEAKKSAEEYVLEHGARSVILANALILFERGVKVKDGRPRDKEA